MSAAPRSPDDLAPDDDLADRADLARLAQVEQALHALLDSGDAVLAAALHEPACALRQALQQLRDRDLLPGSATHRALHQHLLEIFDHHLLATDLLQQMLAEHQLVITTLQPEYQPQLHLAGG